MNQLRSRTVIEHLRALVRQETSGDAICCRIGQWKTDPLKVHDRLPKLLTRGGPADRFVEQALHRSHATCSNVDALLNEPGVLPRVALPNLIGATEHGRLRYHAIELICRMPIGEDVRKGGVVDDLDAGEWKIDEKQRG